MIKLLFDPQIFVEQKYGGISRYHIELLTAFLHHPDTEIVLPLFYSENIHFKESPLYEGSFQERNKMFIQLSSVLRRFLPRKLRKRQKKELASLLRKQDFDLFVPTYYSNDFLPDIGQKPFVLTVHDMIHEIFPEHYPDDPNLALSKKRLLEDATRIISVSENTKRDVLRIYPHIDAAKIDVVYLAASLNDGPPVDLSLPEKYILFTGKRGLYKNFDFFIRAIAPILKNAQDQYLICAGGGAFEADEIELIAGLGLTDKVVQRNFHDFELATYYRRAQCFVFPSRYEGFGIPILEAMGCGCPVVLAHHSSFPEVAGDAGLYFELDNSADLEEKVNELLRDPSRRQEFSERGLKQAKKFSWHRTALECLEVYKKAIGNKNSKA